MSDKLHHRASTFIKGQLLGLALVVLAHTASFALPAEADGQWRTHESGSELSVVDRDLFVELVKLAKFNVHYRLESNRHQPWRTLTYPIARESGTALTFTATLIDLNQQSRGLDNTRRISIKQLKKAVDCGITGNAINGGASALELAQNSWVMISAGRKGYSPKKALSFVKDIVRSTDELLERRDKLTAEQPAPHREILSVETRLVRRIRQQLLYEFATWSCHSRDQAWRENTFFLIDSAQSFTRMSGAILAKQAFETPRSARPAVICALVANSVATINPIVRNIAGFAVRKYQERKLAREIPIGRPEENAPDLEKLHQELASGEAESRVWLRRVIALADSSERIDKELDRETREIERYREVAQQQSISGPLIGLTGVASSTLATVAVFGHARNIDTANKLGFSGRITQGAGQAYSLINTPAVTLTGILKNRELRKRGQLPTQILQERLKRIEAL
jgi:hypothetical protein